MANMFLFSCKKLKPMVNYSYAIIAFYFGCECTHHESIRLVLLCKAYINAL